MKHILLVAFFSISAIGLVSGQSSKIDSVTADSISVEQQLVDSIIKLGESLLGKPYRYKGPSDWPMDCSGFLAYIFGQYDQTIPRTSRGMAASVMKVEVSDLRKGDLMFFTGRNKSDTVVGHVSMVVGVEQDVIRMIHSVRRGIMVDEYPAMKYYRQRFLMAGRVAFVIEEPEVVKQDTVDTIIAASFVLVDSSEMVSVLGVGDMMLGTNFPSKKYLPPNDGVDLLASVTEIITSANVAFGNLEGVILTDSGTVKECSDPEVCYAFKMPNHYAKYFKTAGFDVLSLSNNHVNDFGKEGKLNTVKLLKKEGLYFAGLLRYPRTAFIIDSITYGFCAFSPNNGTVRINDTTRAKEIVRRLDSICDIVIVSFHGGAEGRSKQHITKETEMFLGENRGNPYQFARIVIDAGADVVFGHGPHVTRAIDLYKDRFIAYSLGNFATYARFSLKGISGLAPMVKVFMDKEGAFQYAQIHSIMQVGEGGPIPDPGNGALKEIINLTKVDIPEAPIKIGEDGVVIRK